MALFILQIKFWSVSHSTLKFHSKWIKDLNMGEGKKNQKTKTTVKYIEE